MDRSRSGLIERNLYWIAILPVVLVPLGEALSSAFDDGSHSGLVWTGAALVLLGIAALSVAVRSRYHRLSVADEGTLDERELVLRYRAGATAFRAYWLVTILGCAYLYYAPRLGGPIPSGRGWVWIMFTLGSLGFLLPIIILEWSSDPLAPEEEE